MKENSGTLYIKIDRNCLIKQPKVILSDIAKLECEDEPLLRKIKAIEVHRFRDVKKDHKTVSMSILKIIELIHKIKPGLLVVNEGEPDFILEYQENGEQNGWLEKLKTVVLCIVIFFGSAYTIMAFNNDVGILEMFDKFYLQVMGVPMEGVTELQVCYCIGLAVGITVFFNHIGSKKITPDPTPIQVSMRKYEKDVDSTFIENASRKEHNIDVE